MARAATAAEGILMGESCGTALWAALQVAREVDDSDALFVVLLPDGGRNYLAKLYNDHWLRKNGMIGADERVANYDWTATHPEVIVRR
jgi:cystathionine beta-synthase